MVDQIQTRILSLYATGDHWQAKGMYEVAAIYYAAAHILEKEI